MKGFKTESGSTKISHQQNEHSGFFPFAKNQHGREHKLR